MYAEETQRSHAAVRDLHVKERTRGVKVEHFFTTHGVDPFEEVEWVKRDAVISGEDGKAVFAQKDVEVPSFWSQLATNVVVSKYFRGKLGTPQRERTVKQMIGRVVDTITHWGKHDGYFDTAEDAETFRHELKHLLLYQRASFNSPVWFNVGFEKHPQCSACFILSIEDTMPSILEWIKTEGMIFKGGSGSGINLSALRSSKESMSTGGMASGPVSFMRGADASAGAIKSGGKTRRAAKMVVLNVDHPDILEFIHCKELEEKKAWALGAAGYDMGLNGEAWKSIQFQNANNSVRVTDEYMKKVDEDGDWQTRNIRDGQPADTYKARDILRQIAEATWVCGDPGLQYDTTINAWHTCPNTGRINASNPCSEYMHLDNSACNLASINLMKFLRRDDEFDVEAFKRAVDIMILAQDIVVDNSSYPTPQITKNAQDYRELGLGYANLGALLMYRGLPYDSPEARAYAGVITAMMTGEANAMSANIAKTKGPFAGFEKNREPMLNVIAKHRFSLDDIERKHVPDDMYNAAQASWDAALQVGRDFGIRNSQATVIAPTGTISFMMDCDTTGIEPDIALVKYKTLVGGGMMKIVNQTVPHALKRLGYTAEQVDEILKHLDKASTIEGAPHLKQEHLAVFDCAFKPAGGTRSIQYMGHVKMMSAVQPFISGAISKTVNMPKEATVEEIMEVYIQGWKLGLKALAIYRDGSKRTQPLGTESEGSREAGIAAVGRPQRRRMPDERASITHKFTIAGHEGYITVGLYDDGMPGELFITMAKEGSTISGLMDGFATSISLALQYGVPLKALVGKFSHMRFEPAGFTQNPDVPIAKSLLDYIFRWLGKKFLNEEPAPQKTMTNGNGAEHQQKVVKAQTVTETKPLHTSTFVNQEDAPPCSECGMVMVRNANCYKCINCGATAGCS